MAPCSGRLLQHSTAAWIMAIGDSEHHWWWIFLYSIFTIGKRLSDLINEYIGKSIMSDKKNIIAISGSTRKASSNHNLIKAIAELSSRNFSVSIFEGLTNLPHFNPDLDHENPPKEVADFRKKLREADGILICTPEYAIGVPGTLKNAIDWTVSSMEFSKKPVALITASLSGEKAHQSLLGTLLIIEAKMTMYTQLLIPSIKTKVNEEGIIIHEETLKSVNQLLQSFSELMNNVEDEFLSAPLLINKGVSLD
jgi:chromate reductase, NAD(P)H dehydrogenase (quinone)